MPNKLKALIAVAILLIGFLVFREYKRDMEVRELLSKAKILIEQKKYQEAFSVAARASDIDLNKASEMLSYAALLRNSDDAFKAGEEAEASKRISDAVSYYNEVIPGDAKNFQLASKRWEKLALQEVRRHYKSKDIKYALERVEDILKKNPKNNEALEIKGRLTTADKYFEEADFNKLIREVSGLDIDIAIDRLNAYANRAHPQDKVILAKEQIKLLNTKRQNFLNDIEGQKKQSMYTSAIMAIRSTKLLDARTKIQMIAGLESDKNKYLQKIAVEAKLHNLRGSDFAVNQNYKEAVLEYTKAVEIDPNLSDAYDGRGMAYYSLQEFQKSVEDFSKAISLRPQDPTLYYWRGAAYLSLRQFQKVIQDQSIVIKLNPHNIYLNNPDTGKVSYLAAAYTTRGVAYSKIGEQIQSSRDLNKGCELGMSLACELKG